MSKSDKLVLRPSYWASVSGGKDSLYMLNLILHNLDKYPLDGVVHYELETDYPFVKNVIDYMESECNRIGLKFVRIKPSVKWIDLYNKYGYPSRVCRWCNSQYKLDCARQLTAFLKEQGCYVISYIGYCYDEIKRYEKRAQMGKTEIYPLVDMGIIENDILQWAKTQKLFNDFYLTNVRQGCMMCPMSHKIELAYVYKYYPNEFNYYTDLIRESEKKLAKKLNHPRPYFDKDIDTIIEQVKNKYIYKLEDEERKERLLLSL